MSRRPWSIKPSHVRRAIRGVQETGADVKEIVFDTKGGFVVVLNLPIETTAPEVDREPAKLQHREVEVA